MALTVMLMGFAATASADKKVLKVTSFQSDNMDKTAWDNTTAVTYEANGRTVYCPVVKVRIVNDKLSFQGDIVKTELQETGEYWIYMREGATSLEVVDNTIGSEPLKIKFSSHNVPSLRSRATYILVLTIQTDLNDFYSKKNAFLFGLGGNIHPGGIAFTLGYMYHHFSVEMSVMFGGSTDEKEFEYHYGDDFSFKQTDQWGFDQLAVRLGYEYKLAKHLAVTPQVGVIYTNVSNLEPSASDSFLDEQEPSAWSASLGARLMWIPFGKYFRIYATPQFNMCLSKEGAFEDIYKADSKAKSYVTGPSIEAGLLFYF